MFDDAIDETTDAVLIWGMEYSPSRVLKEVDPIAYRCEFANWCDSEGITTSEDEADEETCAGDDCDESLSDNEGWDGYCGSCADVIAATEEES